jgi:hypothetical protein
MVSVTYSVCIKRSSGFILRVRPGVCLSTPTMIFFNAAWHGYLDVNNISHHRERLPPIQLTFKRGFKQLHHKSWLDSLLKSVIQWHYLSLHPRKRISQTFCIVIHRKFLGSYLSCSYIFLNIY